MDVPDLVRQSLGDEEVVAGVSLGDEDAVCFTPTRTLVYRSEGLLSDEGVSEYPLDFERLAVSEGRRKTKFTLTYVDSESEFTVPGKRTEPVLERLLEGNLQADGVLDANESVTGAFRFSELTLVVGQERLLKHVGGYTWDADFEAYPFEDVTGLHFEDGSVATAVVLEADGGTERIKAPNEQARVVRKTLEDALFAYHDVGSLESLNRTVGVDEESDAAAAGESGGLDLESGIDPLVGDSDDAGDGDSETGQSGATASPTADRNERSAGQSVQQSASTVDVGNAADSSAASGDDLAAVTAQLEELTTAVERQNELLDRQQRTVKQLIEELRRGR